MKGPLSMTIRAAAAAIAALAAASCASSDKPDAAASGIVAPDAGAPEIAIGALSDSTLPEGECGMVLWTLEAEQPTPIFRFVAGEGGSARLNGKEVKFLRTAASGAAGFGVSEEQSFDAEGVKASVKVRFGLGFDGGVYLERGLFTVETADGWRSVIPAAGIAGCRSKT